MKLYQCPNIEFVVFETKDLITASSVTYGIGMIFDWDDFNAQG